MDYSLYVSIGTAVAFVVHAVRATWYLRGMEIEIREKVDAEMENIQRDVKRLEREAMERSDTIRREFGETVTAIRVKIHETETWNRDNFVRTEIFDAAVNRIEKTMDRGFDRVDARLTEALKEFNGRQGRN